MNPPPSSTIAAIRVGHIGLSFHEASAREVARILAEHGCEAVLSAAPHEEMFARLGLGEIDMLVSAWLPASHQKYLLPIESAVRKVTVLYRPYCIWGVPDFVPAQEVKGVADLLKPGVLERMERRIQGINPGAGISRFSAEMVRRYGLDAAGYHFETGTEEDCFGRFIEAHTAKRWVVVPLWHPQFLHHRYRIRALEEPLGLLGGVDEATLLVRRDAEARIGAVALAALEKFTLGNEVVSALDDGINSTRFAHHAA